MPWPLSSKVGAVPQQPKHKKKEKAAGAKKKGITMEVRLWL
jgi:hypothetical protein